jgi:glycine/D-amino acid oxidase-like deaminating enzyme
VEPSLTSLWLSTVFGGDATPGPPLPGGLDVDVAIVGAGYTGLWTAYYLTEADPSLRIAVVEAETVGFGASGRNGGWCSGLLPQSPSALARRYGHPAALALVRAMRSTVDEVGRVAAGEGIDCHYAKGGTLTLVRSPAQRDRARAEVDEDRAFDADLKWLDAGAARKRCGATGLLGATYTPHCAAIHPAKWSTAWPGSCAVAGCRSTSRPRPPRSGPGRPTPVVGSCGPRSWSGPPRRTPWTCPACTATWCRSTR